MLSRATASFGRAATRQPARGMATAQALRQRIGAVENIQKITSAMKMVAVCKLRAAQNNLEMARAYQASVGAIEFAPKDKDKEPESRLIIGISSDRGLCGAINSSISRSVRDALFKAIEEGLPKENAKLLTIGEKCRSSLTRLCKDYFTVNLAEVSKTRPCTFKQCAELTDYWTAVETDQSSVYYQKFKSMIAYTTTEDKFWSWSAVKDEVNDEFAGYEMEGDSDILQNLHEFRQCIKLYQYFAETETSTLSARMQAMENSSTNAKDMITSLKLILNRNRQAKVTAELSEIIGGAAAIEEAD